MKPFVYALLVFFTLLAAVWYRNYRLEGSPDPRCALHFPGYIIVHHLHRGQEHLICESEAEFLKK